jgi:putative phosphoesterase
VRIAALYDIHGNLPALEAAIDAVRSAGADLVVVGGDVVPGPMPRETIACLRALDIPARFIRGNGDREVVAARRGRETLTLPPPALEAIRWNAEQLEPSDEQWLASWPPTETVEADGRRILFCHATPQNDVDILTRLTSDDRWREILAEVDADIVVCGHTHMQFDRHVDDVRVVNAGSVGMPFGDPGAYWLLLADGLDLRRTDYDLEAAVDRIRRTAYPQAESFATENVRRPPSEAELLQVFNRIASTKTGEQ